MEFKEAWNWLEEELRADVAESLGMDSATIWLTLAWMALLLTLLFTFLFVSIKAWSDVGTFSSSVQSCMITLVGGLTSVMKRVPPPEEMDKGGKKIKEVILSQLVAGEDESDDED